MSIENLFSTRERLKILESVVFQTGLLSVNQIAAQLHLSKGLVSKYFDLLAGEGAIKRMNGKFAINQPAPVVKAIKILLNLKEMKLDFLKKYSEVESAGLYGSCAKGENVPDSDVDLWLRVKEMREEKKAALAAELRKRIRNVKPLFLSKEKLKALKGQDELFYHALSFGSILLYGAPNALEL